jgi:hypothetical protein
MVGDGRIGLDVTYSLVLGGRGGDGALRTAVAGVGSVLDDDTVGRAISRRRVGSGKSREKKGNDLGMHLEKLMSEDGGRPSEW